MVEQPIPTVTMDSPQKTVETVGADVTANVNVTVDPLQSNGVVWWILPGKQNVIINDLPAHAFTVTEKAPDNGSGRVFGPLMIGLASRVDRLLTQNGFKKNTLNSSANLQDFSLYDVIQAYQKDKTICTFLINGDSGESVSMASFQCADTDRLAQAEKEQLPFLKLVQNPFDKTDRNQSVVISDIQYYPPLFATVAVNHRRTGYSAILKKINGAYKQISAGQEAPDCTVVDKYEIPKEVVPECYASGVFLRKNTQ